MEYDQLQKDVLYYCRFPNSNSSIKDIYYYYDGRRFLTFIAQKGSGLEICLEPITKHLWSMNGMDFTKSTKASSAQKRMLSRFVFTKRINYSEIEDD